MPGYVYRGNNPLVPEPPKKRPKVHRKELTPQILSNRARSKALVALVGNHKNERAAIRDTIIEEYFGVTYDHTTDYNMARNMAHVVLCRKYATEFAELKIKFRKELEEQYGFTTSPVGVNRAKPDYEEYVQSLVERDFSEASGTGTVQADGTENPGE